MEGGNSKKATAGGPGSKWRRSFPYKVDYNDHFETPLIAYQDILPLLEWLMLPTNNDNSRTTTYSDAVQQQQQRANFCIYDPYYCNGKAATLLRELGFENVIHAPRDFYKDIEQNCFPNYDALVTNPPYSDQHKEDCLTFCFRQLRTEGKPFFILMPNYVAARSYYRQQLLAAGAASDSNDNDNTSESAKVEDVCYIVPTHAYEYEHPEGTGHDVPPFASLWYCGIGKDRVRNVRRYWDNFQSRRASSNNNCPRLAVSVEELQQWNVIPTMKRPNPRRRQKMRQIQQPPSNSIEQGEAPTKQNVASANISKKKSKYRSGTGGRTKKRF